MLKKIFLTIILVAVCFLAIYLGWETQQEFQRVFNNGTNVDDDEAAMKFGAIFIVCGMTFILSLASLVGTWVSPRREMDEGGSS